MTEIDRDAEAYQELLSRHVEGFEDIDLILELSRPDYEPATAQELEARLQPSSAQLRENLGRLQRSGFIITNREGRYVLNEGDSRMMAGIRELQRKLETDTLEVLRDVTAHAMERLRTGAMRALARAFIFNRKP